MCLCEGNRVEFMKIVSVKCHDVFTVFSTFEDGLISGTVHHASTQMIVEVGEFTLWSGEGLLFLGFDNWNCLLDESLVHLFHLFCSNELLFSLFGVCEIMGKATFRFFRAGIRIDLLFQLQNTQIRFMWFL